MKWLAIVLPVVSKAIGRCGLSRTGVVRVLTHLHNDLPARADHLRQRRYARDPNYFIYRLPLLDGSVWHLFEFRVDDVMAPGRLFVVRLSHHK